MSYGNERRCVELLLVPCMFSDVVEHGLDVRGGEGETSKRVQALLQAAIVCALIDLPAATRSKVLDRARKTVRTYFIPFRNNKRVAQTGLAVFYWFQSMILSGYFVLPEDHPLQTALDMLLKELQPTADIHHLDQEARRDAVVLMQVFQRAGLFQNASLAAA